MFPNILRGITLSSLNLQQILRENPAKNKQTKERKKKKTILKEKKINLKKSKPKSVPRFESV